MLEINVWGPMVLKFLKEPAKYRRLRVGRFFDFVKPWLRVKTGLLIFLELQIEC
jgi:hypothetical protein